MAKNMTLKFESHLEYQDDAVNSICDIFEGEEIFQSNFSITPIKGEESALFQRATIGIGNSIKMIEEDMLANMQRIQLRNGVPQSGVVVQPIRFSMPPVAEGGAPGAAQPAEEQVQR